MTQEELKIECLRLSDGDLSDAKKFYGWVMGDDQAKTELTSSNLGANSLLAQYAGQIQSYPYDSSK